MWNFKCYETLNGKKEVQSTFDSGSDELKANCLLAIEYLQVREKQDWTNPRNYAAKLTAGEGYRDFYEIRFKADKVMQRPIGYFGPGVNEFTILIWATEKGGKILPEGWRKKAERLRLQIEGKTAYAKPFKL